MLFASRALSGILSSATLTTALAYVGDSTSEAVIMFIGFLASLVWVAQTRILNQEKSGLVY
jgi:hypothetical protein